MTQSAIASTPTIKIFCISRTLSLLALLPALTACIYQVDSTLDLPDIDPGDYNCVTAAGNCTLRAAAMEAEANANEDTILLPPGTYNLNLPSASGGGRLLFSNPVTLQGSGETNTIINQTISANVIQISDAAVQVNNLAVQGGYAQRGGGFYIGNGAPVVTMSNVRIEGNAAFTGAGGLYVSTDSWVTLRNVSVHNNQATGAFGGGIYNGGSLRVYDSAITDNQSNRAGGIHNAGSLVLRNVSLTGNSATSNSAGVGGIAQLDFAALNNVTVTNNTGVGGNPNSLIGGGIHTTASATTVVKNSIIAGNDGGTGPDDCIGPLSADSKYNLIGSTVGCDISSNVSTYVLNQSANLQSRALNGGTTLSHATFSNSLARDSAYNTPASASDACVRHDQRGVPRPQGAGACDMGSIEYTPFHQFITGHMLVNADTYTDIRPLRQGDTLVLSELPTNISVRSIISSTPGSVVFDFDGVSSFQTENAAPYALDGDTGSNYIAVNFSEGEHSIRSTPFQLQNAGGAAGGSHFIGFYVIE